MELDSGKTKLMEVMITEGTPGEYRSGDKKMKELVKPKELNITEP